ncbi:MAG: D-alanyl-lipoteichoic acid biosynthesis protein DltD [Lachnospiraceae bacterium]|nr:D-alanyl-lipoteichoic acid biosynthesis protein DltD [Lachnospiraceae bacterium]
MMKKPLSCMIAFVLFICVCLGVISGCQRIISDRAQMLTYYNTDTRNSCLWAMKEIFAEESIPVFGSSELSARDEIGFPSSLFHNGASDFNMVLIGRGSMESLHHAINLGAMSDDIPKRKVVLILSPQWFRNEDLVSEAYASRFSERAYVRFLKNNSITKETKQKVTERVKTLLASDPKQLERVEEYETVYLNNSLNPVNRIKLMVYDSFMRVKHLVALVKESNDIALQPQEPVKVKEIDFEKIMSSAENAGKEACTNNEFYIYDEYYDTYVKDVLESMQNTALESSYLDSPQYEDLCLFLDICKETNIEPLIINIPVNGLWYDWIGFPKEDREGYYQKIRDICSKYDVKMADFSDKEYEPYFLKDTMHLGWKGWVYLDEAVYKFYQGSL